MRIASAIPVVTALLILGTNAVAGLSHQAYMRGMIVGFDSRTVRIEIPPGRVYLVPRSSLPDPERIRPGVRVSAWLRDGQLRLLPSRRSVEL
jgi:hypothetical protein